MWATLLFAIVASLALMYIPGYVFARGLNIQRTAALIIAPVFTSFLMTLLGVVFEKVHFSCPAYVLFFATCVLSLLFWALGQMFCRRCFAQLPPLLISLGDLPHRWKQMAFYVGVAVVITGFVYVWPLDGAGSFARNDDTAVHLSLIRGFLDVGYYSTLHTSSYLNLGALGGFYPASWHVLVAVVASVFGNNVALATNALLIVLLAVVFPLIMYLFFAKVCLFPVRTLWLGALFPAALCGFPWGYVVFGQLLPNMLSFMFIPSALVLINEIIEQQHRSVRVALAAVLLICIASIGLAHPNGLFTFGIWAVLYGTSCILHSKDGSNVGARGGQVAAAACLLVIACAVWVAMYHAPFMQGVLTTDWGEKSSVSEAVLAGLAFMFSGRQGLQPLMSICAFCGVLYALRNRQYLWMVMAYLLALCMYVMDMAIDVSIKQFLTGFWYTDGNRTGAMAAFFAIPLVALGFAQLISWSTRLIEKYRFASWGSTVSSRIALGVCVSIFIFACAIPFQVSLGQGSIINLSGLVAIHDQVQERYSWESQYTGEEHEFVQKVLDTIPDGSLVINVPRDGSGWAYGVDGINTYFRRSADYGAGSNAESEILRLNLRDFATSQKVQDVVQKWDIHYVLFLDDLSSMHPTVLQHRYNEENWVGIETITENTDDFKLILREDDMRLYEIDYNLF